MALVKSMSCGILAQALWFSSFICLLIRRISVTCRIATEANVAQTRCLWCLVGSAGKGVYHVILVCCVRVQQGHFVTYHSVLFVPLFPSVFYHNNNLYK